STYRALTQPTEVAPLNELANYIRVNDTNMRAMQNQITNMKIELKNEFQTTMLQQNNKLENMLSNYFQMNKPSGSGSGSGSLPSNIVVNPKGDLKAITTRSGVSYNGPSIPPHFPSIPSWWKESPSLNFSDALLYMPKFASTFKNLLSNKEKLFELANTPVNENCLAVILRSCPKNWETPHQLDASLHMEEAITLVLTPTHMILELADRSTTIPIGIAEDVFVKVGKTVRALIDVYGEELTLRVSDEAITFKVVLGFSNNSENGNPTPTSEPIIAKSSPSLTSFEGGDFILEEIEAYFASDSVLPGIDDAEFDPEGDIRLIEEMLNNDPYSPLLPPKDLKCKELKSVKSSVDEPPEL
ncbi:hypothetical protein Tco_1461233, partial [Tanacetum coccineum]